MAEFCASFQRIDDARGDLRVTYFEFGTLAAIDIFARHGVTVRAVLEVGLGGRLDAVNALMRTWPVSSIGLDHQDWLGRTGRASVARRPASSAPAGRPSAAIGKHRPR